MTQHLSSLTTDKMLDTMSLSILLLVVKPQAKYVQSLVAFVCATQCHVYPKVPTLCAVNGPNFLLETWPLEALPQGKRGLSLFSTCAMSYQRFLDFVQKALNAMILSFC